MNIGKYIQNISENDERKINEYLSHYPELDEYELIELVKKKLPSTNIVRTFCTVIDKHWQELRKTNLLVWDINLYLDSIGFVGSKVEKYYLGLILNHIYQEYSSAHDINTLLDKIIEFLGEEKTYQKIIEMVMKSNFVKKMNIPYQTLKNLAEADIKEYDLLEEKVRKRK